VQGGAALEYAVDFLVPWTIRRPTIRASVLAFDFGGSAQQLGGGDLSPE